MTAALVEFRWSCCLCSKPDQPIVRTRQGKAALCEACLKRVEPDAIHPDACTCGRGCRAGFCSDENHSEDR